jgi:hypothetical protein
MVFAWNSGKNTWGYAYSNSDRTVTTLFDGPRTQSAAALPDDAKSYVEIAFDTVVGSDIRIGLSSSGWGDYDAGLAEIYSAGSIGLLWGNTGYDFVYLRGNGGDAVNQKSGPWLASDVVRIAIDRTASPALAWFAVNDEDWNGSATADPATGVGGVDVSFISGDPYVALTHLTGAAGGVNTLNGGDAAFAFTKPSGFTGPSEPAAPTAYTLTADSGSFSLTGQAASLLKGSLLAAASGSYVLTGSAASLSYTTATGYTLTADSGVFNLAGADASLLYGRKVAAASGAFALAGQTATLKAGRTLAAAFGQFTLAGQAATLSYAQLNAYTLTALGGTYVLTGGEAAFLGRVWTAVPITPETWTAQPAGPGVSWTAEPVTPETWTSV